MKRVFLTVLALLTLGAGAPAARAQERLPVAGGYIERPLNDRDVAAAAAFAVRERARRTGRRVTLLSVVSAESQVVAGTNYRLVMDVREGREQSSVTVVVHQSLRHRLSLTSWEPTPSVSLGREVKVYLVALDDNGSRGIRVGCNDSLVPVTRTVNADAEPLRAAVEELLAVPRDYEGGLKNFWWGENLSVQSVAIRSGVATIRLKGNVYIAGVCDAPRIEGQIRETARQFRGVRSVRVFVGGRRLADVLR